MDFPEFPSHINKSEYVQQLPTIENLFSTFMFVARETTWNVQKKNIDFFLLLFCVEKTRGKKKFQSLSFKIRKFSIKYVLFRFWWLRLGLRQNEHKKNFEKKFVFKAKEVLPLLTLMKFIYSNFCFFFAICARKFCICNLIYRSVFLSFVSRQNFLISLIHYTVFPK